jgi:hypothetical protein
MQGGFSGWTSSKLQTKMSNTVSAVEILAPVFGTVKKAASSSNGNRVWASSCAACLCATGSLHLQYFCAFFYAHCSSDSLLYFGLVTCHCQFVQRSDVDVHCESWFEASHRQASGIKTLYVRSADHQKCAPKWKMRFDSPWLSFQYTTYVPSWHQSSSLVRASAK